MPTLTELTGKPYLSYSSMHTYLECGEKYRLQKIEKVPESPAYWLPGGTAVHTGTEVFDLCHYVDGLVWDDAVNSAVLAFNNKFTEEVIRYSEAYPTAEWRAGGRRTKDNPNGEDSAWWRRMGAQMVVDYAVWRRANPQYVLWTDPNGVVGVEYPFDSPFAGIDLPAQGYIDRIFQSAITGELMVVDIKSGSRVPADVTQLAMYASAIEEQWGTRPRIGAYYMTRKGELAGLEDLTRFNADLLGGWMRDVKDGIESQRFTPRLSSDCGYCSVRDFCYAQNPDIPVPTR